MARIVYIPSIDDSTSLRLSTQGNAACLRRYFLNEAGEIQRVENYDFNTPDLQDRIENEPEATQSVPMHYPLDDNEFWFNRIRDYNIKLKLVPDDGTDLQESFRTRISDPALDQQGLGPIRDQWIRGLAAINPWTKNRFNHWCVDPPEYNGREEHAYKPRTGRGWQETLLSYCRPGGADAPIRYIPLHGGEEHLFFAAQEVGFSISAVNNPFANDKSGLITPDGIGQVICPNDQEPGWAAVFEVKGPQDNNYAPQHAISQAICGATAMYANRKLVQGRFADPPQGSLRPAAAVRIRQQSRDISLFLLISTTRDEVAEAWSHESLDAPAMRDRIQGWLATFGFLKDIRVHLFPDEGDLFDPNNDLDMQQRRQALEAYMLSVLADEPSRVITPV